MVDINIGSGQGMTQAIATNLNLSEADKKKVSLSTWQEVMTLVDSGSQKTKDGGSIFGNKRDASKIGEKSSNTSNFLVHTGQKVEIDNSIWNKIVQLLTGKTPENAQKAETLKAPQAAVSVKAPLAPGQIQQANPVSTAAPVAATGVVPEIKKSQNPPLIDGSVPPEGDIKTGEKVDKYFRGMTSLSGAPTDVGVTSDEWRAKINNPATSKEEKAKLMEEYNNNMKIAGGSYAKYLSQKYGDNSGSLDEASYIKFEMDVQEHQEKPSAEDCKIAFKRLDLDGDGKIGEKEMSAYMMSLDFDTKNNANGIIDESSYYPNALILKSPKENNSLDKKLAYSYQALYGAKTEE